MTLPRFALSTLALAVGILAGCGGADETASADSDVTASAKVTLDRAWVLKSDGLTQGPTSLHATIGLPHNYKYAKVSVDHGPAQVVSRAADGSLAADVPVGDLEVGEHKVVVASKTSGKIVGR